MFDYEFDVDAFCEQLTDEWVLEEYLKEHGEEE